MPVYEYECSKCEKVFEVQQRIADDPIKFCSVCQGEVKKLVSMSSFQLKGGGWYADGYASATANSSKATEKTTEKTPSTCETGGGCKGCPAAAASS